MESLLFVKARLQQARLQQRHKGHKKTRLPMRRPKPLLKKILKYGIIMPAPKPIISCGADTISARESQQKRHGQEAPRVRLEGAESG